MPFVKLDAGILRSTIWYKRPAMEVFLTALLMAEPRELEQDTPTLKVDSLEADPFVIPKGWYGFAATSGPGIVKQSGILDEAAGLEALRQLSMPEVESRSQEFEGRRMVRINGGYIVLNYMRYRDYDHQAAERMRKLRRRRKSEPVTLGNEDVTAGNGNGVTRNSVTVRPNVTHSREQIAESRENTLIPEPPSAPRKRDPLKDAIAAIGGSDPLQTPKGRWSAIQKVLTDILSVTPDLSPSEIHRRETNYRLHYPNVACTPEALAKWWALCEHPPGLAGRPKRSPEEIAEEQERLAKAFPAV